jgi:PAS domain S-box-containing protein
MPASIQFEAIMADLGSIRSVVGAVLDASPAAIYVKDAQGNFTVVNRQWELLSGVSREEARGRTVFNLFPREIAEVLHVNDREVIESGRAIEREESVVFGGQARVFLSLKSPLHDESGNVIGLCGISTDITGRKQAEEALRLSEERFRLLVENAPDCAILMLDPQGRIMSWNPGAERMTGYTAAEVLGLHASVFYPEECVLAGRPAEILDTAEKRGRAEEEGWRVRKDGSRYWASVIVTALRAPDGALRGFARITRDLSEHKATEEKLRAAGEALERAIRERTRELEAESIERRRAEELLRRSEEYYRSLIESTLDIIAIAAPDGAIRYVNPAGRRVFGYELEDVIGTSGLDLVHPEDRGMAEAALQQIQGPPGATGRLECRVRAKDGSWRVLETIAKNLSDVPAVSGIVLVCREVTERRRAERELRESQRFVRGVAETAPYALYVYDLRVAGMVYANRPALELLSAEFPSMRMEDLRAMIAPEDLPAIEGQIARLVASAGPETAEVEFRVKTPSRGWRWIYSRNNVFRRAADGSVEQILGTAQDITDRKEAERALRENQKALQRTSEQLRALARRLLVSEEEERKALSRELHDDLSQRLAILAVDIDILSQELPPSPQKTHRALTSLGERVAELSDDVRRMAHHLRPSILDDLGLVPALRSYCADFSRRERIRVRCAHHRVPGSLPPDASLCLYRVAQEALRNVAKHSGAKQAVVRVWCARDRVWILVRDFGVGFDPTAGARGGLGITSMQERARLAGGTFILRSRPGFGTRVGVGIPFEETT